MNIFTDRYIYRIKMQYENRIFTRFIYDHRKDVKIDYYDYIEVLLSIMLRRIDKYKDYDDIQVEYDSNSDVYNITCIKDKNEDERYRQKFPIQVLDIKLDDAIKDDINENTKYLYKLRIDYSVASNFIFVPYTSAELDISTHEEISDILKLYLSKLYKEKVEVRAESTKNGYYVVFDKPDGSFWYGSIQVPEVICLGILEDSKEESWKYLYDEDQKLIK